MSAVNAPVGDGVGDVGVQGGEHPGHLVGAPDAERRAMEALPSKR